jgi:hypothetical protein
MGALRRNFLFYNVELDSTLVQSAGIMRSPVTAIGTSRSRAIRADPCSGALGALWLGLIDMNVHAAAKAFGTFAISVAFSAPRGTGDLREFSQFDDSGDRVCRTSRTQAGTGTSDGNARRCRALRRQSVPFHHRLPRTYVLGYYLPSLLGSLVAVISPQTLRTFFRGRWR